MSAKGWGGMLRPAWHRGSARRCPALLPFAIKNARCNHSLFFIFYFFPQKSIQKSHSQRCPVPQFPHAQPARARFPHPTAFTHGSDGFGGLWSGTRAQPGASPITLDGFFSLVFAPCERADAGRAAGAATRPGATPSPLQGGWKKPPAGVGLGHGHAPAARGLGYGFPSS